MVTLATGVRSHQLEVQQQKPATRTVLTPSLGLARMVLHVLSQTRAGFTVLAAHRATAATGVRSRQQELQHQL
jgi:hypothetical protein